VEDDVPKMLDMFDVLDELSFADLEKNGMERKTFTNCQNI
jgi:hypothetical protein